METLWATRLAKRLEQWAQFAHRRFAGLAVALLFSVLLLLASDNYLHWMEAIIPSSWVASLGKKVGKVAFFLGFVATLYYGVRDLFTMARRMKLPIPAWLDSLAKYWITVLRLGHPFLGTLVLAVVAFHGYVMWKVWAGGNFDFAVETGFVATIVLLLVAISGLFIRWMPKMFKLRLVHRLVGILFVLTFVLHKMVD